MSSDDCELLLAANARLQDEVRFWRQRCEALAEAGFQAALARSMLQPPSAVIVYCEQGEKGSHDRQR